MCPGSRALSWGVTVSSHGKLATPVTSSHSSNILVIGAGIVGCAVAYELARRGASVQVIDDRPPGMGATQASAGMLAPYHGSQGSQHELFLDLAVRSLELYDEFVARVAGDAGAAVGYKRTGTIEIADTAERMTVLRDIARRLAGRGVALEVLDAASRARARAAAGPRCRRRAAHWRARLRQRARDWRARSSRQRAAWARRSWRAAASADQSARRRSSGRSGQPHADCRTVVVAAGSWSGQIEIEGAAALPVRPVRGQMLHLAWKSSPALRRVTWGERCYLVPWDDGTLLVGATMEEVGFDEKTTTAGVQTLLDAACELVPHVRDAGFLECPCGPSPGNPGRDANRRLVAERSRM